MAKTFRINDLEEKHIQRLWKDYNDAKHRNGEKMVSDTVLIHKILEKALKNIRITKDGELEIKTPQRLDD